MWADFQKQKTARIDEMKDAIGAASKAIEADIDIYQGKRDAIPLFKLYPNVGKEVEAVLEEVKAMRAEVDKLAEPARQRAKEMYGEEFLAPPRVGGSKEKKEKNKSHPTVEPKSRRARAKKVKVEEEENDEGEVEDSESEQADDAENEEREDCESEEEDEDQEEEDDEDEEDEEQSDMEDDD